SPSNFATLSLHDALPISMVQAALDEYAHLVAQSERAVLSTIGYAVRINNLKIAASEAAVDACQHALRVCGVSGYRNGGPFSIGRSEEHTSELQSAENIVC